MTPRKHTNLSTMTSERFSNVTLQVVLSDLHKNKFQKTQADI